jgi:fido (protein-threonine AMPylation protein)
LEDSREFLLGHAAGASQVASKGITTRRELNLHEIETLRKAIAKYLVAKPSRRSARFDLSWVKRLRRELRGDVWKWAGQIRRSNLNLGVDWLQIETRLEPDLLSGCASS